MRDQQLIDLLLSDSDHWAHCAWHSSGADAKACYKDRAERLAAAAERIRVLGEECEAWRACPKEHFAKVWDQPQMSGCHRSEYRQKINEARAATDAARRGA